MSEIATERQEACPLCGGEGDIRFADRPDVLFAAPGRWNLRACRSCEALWLDPRPTPSDIGKAYGRYYTHAAPQGSRRLISRARLAVETADARRRHGFKTGWLSGAASAIIAVFPGAPAEVDLMARHLTAAQRGGGRLLDVGCGDGSSFRILAALGWRCHGLEVDPAAAAAARRWPAEIREGTVEATDFPSGSFDAVTSSHVLEHVHDPLSFLEGCRRLATPSGTVVAITPNSRSPMALAFGRDWLGLDTPRHLILYNEDNLAELARKAGFGRVEIRHSARAAGFAHLASALTSRQGRYEWGQWPGLAIWLQSRLRQIEETRRVRVGGQGEELVLIASS